MCMQFHIFYKCRCHANTFHQTCRLGTRETHTRYIFNGTIKDRCIEHREPHVERNPITHATIGDIVAEMGFLLITGGVPVGAAQSVPHMAPFMGWWGGQYYPSLESWEDGDEHRPDRYVSFFFRINLSQITGETTHLLTLLSLTQHNQVPPSAYTIPAPFNERFELYIRKNTNYLGRFVETHPAIPLPSSLLDEDGKAECSICLFEVMPEGKIIQLDCKHWFHPKCTWTWLRRNNTCPMCRQIVNLL